MTARTAAQFVHFPSVSAALWISLVPFPSSAADGEEPWKPGPLCHGGVLLINHCCRCCYINSPGPEGCVATSSDLHEALNDVGDPLVRPRISPRPAGESPGRPGPSPGVCGAPGFIGGCRSAALCWKQVLKLSAGTWGASLISQQFNLHCPETCLSDDHIFS